MLETLQRQHNETYQLDGGHDVRDFLITSPLVAGVIGQSALPAGSGETLFLSQDEHGLGMSLFLDGELLARVERSDPLSGLQPRMLADFCQVLEGISHFNCMAFKAGRDREVSLLELELQGEIDKFVASAQIAVEHGDNECLHKLHGWLFDDVGFHDELDAAAMERYRTANDYAARFCRHLLKRLTQNDSAALEELRMFFRLPIAEKMSLIHGRCWRSAN